MVPEYYALFFEIYTHIFQKHINTFSHVEEIRLLVVIYGFTVTF